METNSVEVKINGKVFRVPAVEIGNRTVVATGKWLRMATVHEEMYLEGKPVEDPPAFLKQLKGRLKADIFAFSQQPTDAQPKYEYPYEWDNVAAAPTTDFKAWWEGLPQEARKNLRRAGKRGVVLRTFELNDEFIRSIMEIYNETPIRQGMRFWHYGKDFATVKEETSTFPGRSEFIGAFYQNELIGFIKMVYVGPIASIMGIVSKNSHQDKRTTNALLVKAAEVCHEKKISYLVYGKYVYGNKRESPLTEFKRRTGFQELRFPRYYVPLTLRGQIAVRLKLYRGLSGLLPARLVEFLLNVRARFVERMAGVMNGAAKAEASEAVQPGTQTPESVG